MELATILKSAVCRTRVFPRPAPSLFYFPGLGTKPVYDREEDEVVFKSYVRKLTENFNVILDEYKSVQERNDSSSASDYTLSNDEHKLNNGEWVWNSFILKGKQQEKFQINYPSTSKILKSLLEEKPKLMSGTPFSYAFFSTLKKKSKIDPHYGPCNLRIRCHFPLIIPEGDCGMEVGGKIIKWEVGVPLFFDDCYEHRVWNNSEEDRVVLLFDIWHPELQPVEIDAISEMFAFAEEKGWTKK